MTTEQTFKLELTVSMINVIAAALNGGPYNQVAPVIAELQKQITAQQAPANEEV